MKVEVQENMKTKITHKKSMVKNHFSLASFFKWLLLIAMCVMVFLPIIIIIFNAFKSPSEYMSTGVFTPPESFLNLENFKTALIDSKMYIGFLNSAILIIIPVLLNVFLGTMTAYALERFNFKGKWLIMLMYTMAILIPNTTTQVATFSIIKSIGVFNTYFAGFILYAGTDMIQVNIYRQQLGEIPYSLDEAALIDGASYFKIYRSIILPLLKPATVTVVVLKAIGIYNDLFNIYLYMPKIRTVSYTLYKFAAENNSQWTVMSAAIILALIPSVIVYFVAQKSIYDGIIGGSVKQ